MTYHAMAGSGTAWDDDGTRLPGCVELQGLGATRPSWCPARTFNSGVQDPCEIEYSVDLPIVGRTTMAIPVDQMTNDAILTAERQLPQLLDRNLPMVYAKLQPFLDQTIASAMADLQYSLTETLQKALDKQVLPAVRTQEEEVIAEAEVVVEKAILGLAALGALGVGAWLYFRKP